MDENTPILTVAGRNWLKKQFPEVLEDLRVCVTGWFDTCEGIPVSDQFVLTERLHISAATPSAS